MRIVAANWKMHKLRDEAARWARQVALSPLGQRAELFVFPAAPLLEPVRRELQGSPVRLGAQDVFWEPEGAYTGMVSAAQLSDAGCSAVLVAHSERRRYAGEDDEGAGRKLRAATAAGLLAIYCVGEDAAARAAGRVAQALRAQWSVGLQGLAPAVRRGAIAVAYEPVWAIGSGQAATPQQAAAAAAAIREGVAALLGDEAAAALRILYGGSVNPANVGGFLAAAGVDGLLVGSASLAAEGFLELVKAVVDDG